MEKWLNRVMVRIKASRNWDMMMMNKSFKLEEPEKTRLRAMNTIADICQEQWDTSYIRRWHVLLRTQTARTNGARLINSLISGQRHSNITCVIIMHTHNALASFIRREGHLYDDFSWEAGLKLDYYTRFKPDLFSPHLHHFQEVLWLFRTVHW